MASNDYLQTFPGWLAGNLVNEGSGEGNWGIFKIRHSTDELCLFVKDLRRTPSLPTMETLKRFNFPFSVLDENVFAPRKTLPGSPDESTSDSTPVLLIQANIIWGGLLLTFVGQNNTMDMTGQGLIVRLFSKACCNEDFTSEELLSGKLSRSNLIPSLEESSNEGSAFAHRSCIARRLKALASNAITLPSGYISTDDALSAFLWQSILRARNPRLDPAAKSTFGPRC